MKKCIIKITSLLLLVAVLCSILPSTIVHAAASDLDPFDKLSGLSKKNQIIDRINKYFSNNCYLADIDETTIFFFEGGSNSTIPYTIRNTRDQAVAVITKNGKITNVYEKCSTIPDVPDKYYNTAPSAANVCDGIYKFVAYYHQGNTDKPAFQIRTISGNGNLPCIRFDKTNRKFGSYTANGINIHGRKGMTSASRDSTSPWSMGCILVGDKWNENIDDKDDFASFRTKVAEPDTWWADWYRKGKEGYVVIDRKLAKDKLENSELYNKYPGAVDAILGEDIVSEDNGNYITAADIRIADGKYNPGTLEVGKSYSINGLISSANKLVYVKVGVYNINGSPANYEITKYPHTKTYDIKNVDSAIKFGKLPVGTYKFRVEATDSIGKTKRLVDNTFRVESKIKIANGKYNPGTLKKGKSYSINGLISSSSKLTYVKVGVYNNNGTNAIFEKTATPNTKTYDIKKLDSYIKFGKLLPGVYDFKVEARDSTGKFVTLVNNKFTVR